MNIEIEATGLSGVRINGEVIPWRDLELAAAQDDPAYGAADEETRMLALHYRGILAIARQQERERIERERTARIRAHRGSHKAISEVTRGFTGCVAAADCDPRAHGGVSIHDTCSCGATRVCNVNQTWGEESEWA